MDRRRLAAAYVGVSHRIAAGARPVECTLFLSSAHPLCSLSAAHCAQSFASTCSESDKQL
jgi:hypothetical protein